MKRIVTVVALLVLSVMATAKYYKQELVELKAEVEVAKKENEQVLRNIEIFRGEVVSAVRLPKTITILIEQDGSVKFRNELTLSGKIFRPNGKNPEDFFPTR